MHDTNRNDSPERRPVTSLKQRAQRWVQLRVWRMDIHPTAWIAASALIDRTWPKGIHIHAGVTIDEEAVVLTHDMTRGIYKHTTVGEGSFIGARAILMPGVTVGTGCIVEPGSVVIRDLPDHCVASGNPAQITATSHEAPRGS